MAVLPRRVEPELLDDMAVDDPRAVRSRRDLRRLNRLMGNAWILRRALDRIVDPGTPPHLVELGAGDGTLMLRLARRRAKPWAGARVTLVDRQPCVSAATLDAMRRLGWQPEVVSSDAFDWLAQAPAAAVDVVIANLFMHHFAGKRLFQLMHGIARRARAFACCEPRRSSLALAASHLVGVVGCSAVTRHDAVLSVHAGFRDRELTAMWPPPAARNAWHTTESGAGPFSHLFVARRTVR